MNQLVKFWNLAPLDCAPFVHPHDDMPCDIMAINVNCFSDYVKQLNEGTLSRTDFHLSLLPSPYLGDLDNAEIILVMLNPGLHPSDYIVEEQCPEFKTKLIDTIRQQNNPSLLCLDPQWAWTAGFSWWHGKLRAIAEIISCEKFKGHYGRALSDLARRIACVELVPYHSISFGGHTNLASTHAAISYIRQVAKCGDQKIILTRAARYWGLEANDNVIIYSSGQARGASLSPKSQGGRTILAAYGIAT